MIVKGSDYLSRAFERFGGLNQKEEGLRDCGPSLLCTDLVGRATGNRAAMNAWAKSLIYFEGRRERER